MLFTVATLVSGMDARIDAVRVAGTPDGPVGVLLLAVEEDDEHVLPIFIGLEEATSIAHGVDAEDIGRPLTHDLLLDVMEELGGRVDRVVIDGVEDGTYLADLHVETPREIVVVDARPSDSIALAARTNTPIEVAEEVFTDGRRVRDELADLTDIREVTEFA